jgi:hypothetical protein
MATKYKITEMNTGFGDKIFTVSRVDKTQDGEELVSVRPYKEFKTRAGASRDIKRRIANN